MHDIRICPSILNADRSNLFEEMRRIEGTADWLHLDIMDGNFVPAVTFNIEEATSIIRNSQIPVDTHLMIANPDDLAIEYARAGSKSVTIHYEASRTPKQTLTQLQKAGSRRGLAIKPNTPVEEVFDLLDDVDMLLVMTVEPGAGGQAFMPEMLTKVRLLRNLITQGKSSQWIQVDGGISLATIEEAARAGADTFVAGSAVYKSSNPGIMVEDLKQLATMSFKS